MEDLATDVELSSEFGVNILFWMGKKAFWLNLIARA